MNAIWSGSVAQLHCRSDIIAFFIAKISVKLQRHVDVIQQWIYLHCLAKSFIHVVD